MGKAKRNKPDASSEKPRFSKDMLIIDALELDSRVEAVLTKQGLPCHTCIVALHETLAEGCAPLGKDVDRIVAELNLLAEGAGPQAMAE